ncbi:hypothetical protein [Phyllobacterium ifriqiyense]|uniref:hypothetical protein n=1 Tax=Phyllobacterium ifriqiyense TaxID=314238 RepID=UPI0033922249
MASLILPVQAYTAYSVEADQQAKGVQQPSWRTRDKMCSSPAFEIAGHALANSYDGNGDQLH